MLSILAASVFGFALVYVIVYVGYFSDEKKRKEKESFAGTLVCVLCVMYILGYLVSSLS